MNQFRTLLYRLYSDFIVSRTQTPFLIDFKPFVVMIPIRSIYPITEDLNEQLEKSHKSDISIFCYITKSKLFIINIDNLDTFDLKSEAKKIIYDCLSFDTPVLDSIDLNSLGLYFLTDLPPHLITLYSTINLEFANVFSWNRNVFHTN
jgi:hypothetical protein